MAEWLAREFFKDSVSVSSAGLRPQPAQDAGPAVRTLALEFKIDASSHIPQDVKTLDLAAFDCIVAMDKYVAKELRSLTQRALIVWEIDDPYGAPAQYPLRAREILKKITNLKLSSNRDSD